MLGRRRFLARGGAALLLAASPRRAVAAVRAADPPDLAAAVAALVAPYAAQGGRVGLMLALPGQAAALSHDADEPFASASLYKLFVLWQVQVAIAAGRLADDEVLVLGAADDDAAEDGAPLGDYGDEFTVATLRDLMITRSNNTAAWMLADRLGWGTIDPAIQAGGFPRSSVLEGITTPREIALYFQALLTGSLDPRLDARDYALILDLLRAQQINDLLPAGLPPGVPFAHKTGALPGVLNDAGIFWRPDGTPALVAALTGGDEEAGRALLRALAALAWDHATAAP